VPADHALVQAHDTGGPSDPAGIVTLTGLFKKVDDTRHRVYLTRDLSSYAEYDAGDFLGSEKVDAENSPIPGEEAARVTLKRGARVSFVHSVRTSVTADNQSDLDVRTGVAPGAGTVAYGPHHTLFKTATYGPDHTIIKTTKTCTTAIFVYDQDRGICYPLYGGTITPLSTVPCHYTITNHTITE
jgi:hypothetical protein